MDEQSPTGDALREAAKKVPKDTKAEHRTEEILAYLVANNKDVGPARRFIALLKNILVKLCINPKIFTANDFTALAESAVRREARGGNTEKAQGKEPLFATAQSEPDERNPPPIGNAETPEEINRRTSSNRKQGLIRAIRSATKQALHGVDKFLGASSTRLRNIHRNIEQKFRKLDYDTGTRHTRDVKAVLPLM